MSIQTRRSRTVVAAPRAVEAGTSAASAAPAAAAGGARGPVDRFSTSTTPIEVPVGQRPVAPGTGSVTDVRLGRVRPRAIGEDETNKLVGALLSTAADELAALGREPMPMVDFSVAESDLRVHHDGLFFNLIVSKGAVDDVAGNRDVLALRVAHEIGHIIGAGPRLEFQETASEGEADYRAPEILRRAFQQGAVDWQQPPADDDDVAAARAWLVGRGVGPGPRLELDCRLALAGLASLRTLEPGLSFLDLQRSFADVDVTWIDYPPVAVRLQTYMAGIVGDPRPRSWANPADF